MVKGLEDDNGRLVEEDKELIEVVTKYFEELFSPKSLQQCENLWRKI